MVLERVKKKKRVPLSESGCGGKWCLKMVGCEH